MKLFMILVVSGQIGGVAGPLPYGMDECNRRANEYNAEFLEKSRDPALATRARSIGWDGTPFVWHCVERDARPRLEEKFP